MGEGADEADCYAYTVTVRITPGRARLEIQTPPGHKAGGWLTLLDAVAERWGQ